MTVLFLAPLPPPLHGFSAINAAMLSHLSAVTDVIVFNRSPGRPSGGGRLNARFRAAVNTVVLFARFAMAAFVRRPRSLYVGLSGGAGQLLDLPFLCVARLAQLQMTVHHHSFAYLRHRSIVTSVCMWATRTARHVVLCDDMAERLLTLYGVARANTFQLSNAAFLQVTNPSAPVAGSHGDPVRVGFLSNITEEKGVFEFLEIVRLARVRNICLKATIVGPLDERIARRFRDEIEGMPEVAYLGALYGAQKGEFFRSIDVLLFPSKYVNEAEPVTVLEALAAGVEVVATSRGCLGGMLRDGCGQAAGPEEYASAALSTLVRVRATPVDERLRRRSVIEAAFQTMYSAHAQRLQTLVSDLSYRFG